MEDGRIYKWVGKHLKGITVFSILFVVGGFAAMAYSAFSIAVLLSEDASVYAVGSWDRILMTVLMVLSYIVGTVMIIYGIFHTIVLARGAYDEVFKNRSNI